MDERELPRKIPIQSKIFKFHFLITQSQESSPSRSPSPRVRSQRQCAEVAKKKIKTELRPGETRKEEAVKKVRYSVGIEWNGEWEWELKDISVFGSGYLCIRQMSNIHRV